MIRVTVAGPLTVSVYVSSNSVELPIWVTIPAIPSAPPPRVTVPYPSRPGPVDAAIEFALKAIADKPIPIIEISSLILIFLIMSFIAVYILWMNRPVGL